MRATFFSFLIIAALFGTANAVEPDEVLADLALEARARAISQELRCLVCQNETIDESNAPLAKDLRIIVRERLIAGDTDEAVIQYVVERYGDYVLLRPPIRPATWLLWFGPLVLLIVGFVAIPALCWQRNQTVPPLTDQERSRLNSALEDAE
jgi:cytochrome c-type biogenesis protein CcmH